jgi:hypothetical protein
MVGVFVIGEVGLGRVLVKVGDGTFVVGCTYGVLVGFTTLVVGRVVLLRVGVGVRVAPR